MQVSKRENAEGELLEIEFVSTIDEDFKGEIKKWMRSNMPQMSYEQIFSKLIEFRNMLCRINMQD